MLELLILSYHLGKYVGFKKAQKLIDETIIDEDKMEEIKLIKTIFGKFKDLRDEPA